MGSYGKPDACTLTRFRPAHLDVPCPVCAASKGSRCRNRFTVALAGTHTQRAATVRNFRKVQSGKVA